MFRVIKTTILNGLLVLLPLLLLIVIIKEFFELIIGLATPIADLFPRDTIESIHETTILAVLLILGSAFLIGVLAKVPLAATIGGYLESRILNKIPVYIPLKTLLHALLGAESTRAYQPAFIHGTSGELEPAYIIEDTGRPRITVLVPWTPNSFAGSLRLVPRDRVHKVELTFDQFSLSIGHYGLGLSELLPEAPEELRIPKDSEDSR